MTDDNNPLTGFVADTPLRPRSRMEVRFRGVGAITPQVEMLGEVPGVFIKFVDDPNDPTLLQINADVVGFDMPNLIMFLKDMVADLEDGPEYVREERTQ